MQQITGINHVGLRVTDLETSRAFYEKLGFVFLAGPIGPEPVAVMEHPSGVNINFILNSSDTTPKNVLMDIPEKHAGYTHIALEVSDMDSTTAYLQSENIAISEGPINIHNGAILLFIRDPDANVIEFHLPAQ